MKCGSAQGVTKNLQPVAETPRPLDGLRTQMSLESNAIWTDSMLEALKTGVKGGRWYSLMDKFGTQTTRGWEPGKSFVMKERLEWITEAAINSKKSWQTRWNY